MADVVITGNLDPYFETGTEGVIWSVQDVNKSGRDGLCPLNDGDHLLILNKDKDDIVWMGNIDFEWERNIRPFPMNPQYSQQEVLGYWVHGLQKTVEPEQWGKWFFEGLPAVLTRGPIPGRMYPVDSTNLEKYFFENVTNGSYNLIVKFKNGSYYKYKELNEQARLDFYSAASKGSFIGTHIKGKYDYEKLEI